MIRMEDSDPIYKILDYESKGIMDWDYFQTSVTKLIKEYEVGKIIDFDYDMGLSNTQIQNIYKFFGNIFLVDYSSDLNLINSLAQDLESGFIKSFPSEEDVVINRLFKGEIENKVKKILSLEFHL